MARTPTRMTATRPEAEEAPVAQKKTRIRKNASQRSMLDIDSAIVDLVREQYGQDLQWVTSSILGKDEPAMRQSFEINAWEPVTPKMFGGVFDGMYTRKGHDGEINVGGLVLMYRPIELTQDAQEEDQRARINAVEAHANMVKSGQLPGFSAGFEPNHPLALAGNKFNRSIKPPMDIPTD